MRIYSRFSQIDKMIIMIICVNSVFVSLTKRFPSSNISLYIGNMDSKFFLSSSVNSVSFATPTQEVAGFQQMEDRVSDKTERHEGGKVHQLNKG